MIHLKAPLVILCLILLGLSTCTEPKNETPSPATVSLSEPTSTTPATVTPSWPIGFDVEAVTTIELKNEEDHVVLTRTGTEWMVPAWQNWPAEQHFVRALLRGVSALESREPVGFFPTEGALFGFDKPNRIIFSDSQNRSLAVTVGAAGKEPRDAFVRIDDGPTIFKVPAPWFANTHRPTWGSRTVWQVPPDLVHRIEWTEAGQTTMKVVKTDQRWQVATPTDANLINQFGMQMLPAFAHFRSQGLRFDPAADFGTRRPIAHLKLAAAEAEMKVTFYESKDGQYIEGYRDGYPVVYLFGRNVLTMPKVTLGGL